MTESKEKRYWHSFAESHPMLYEGDRAIGWVVRRPRSCEAWIKEPPPLQAAQCIMDGFRTEEDAKKAVESWWMEHDYKASRA